MVILSTAEGLASLAQNPDDVLFQRCELCTFTTALVYMENGSLSRQGSRHISGSQPQLAGNNLPATCAVIHLVSWRALVLLSLVGGIAQALG